MSMEIQRILDMIDRGGETINTNQTVKGLYERKMVVAERLKLVRLLNHDCVVERDIAGKLAGFTSDIKNCTQEMKERMRQDADMNNLEISRGIRGWYVRVPGQNIDAIRARLTWFDVDYEELMRKAEGCYTNPLGSITPEFRTKTDVKKFWKESVFAPSGAKYPAWVQ